jgi:hypothetical protein
MYGIKFEKKWSIWKAVPAGYINENYIPMA